MILRKIKKIYKSQPTLEGAGVFLHRVFSNPQVPEFDPFLLFDDFSSDEKSKYIKGFPWHPHRGIETITYILEGSVEHADSMGNQGIISKGDVQWMTAGSGIIHQEMPLGNEKNRMCGFQLWANLPASHKMMSPRYREVKSNEIPEVTTDNGTKIKIISGTYNNVSGPVKDIITEPEYLDMSMPSDSSFIHTTKRDNTVFIYIFEGAVCVANNEETIITKGSAILFEKGESIKVISKNEKSRFLLISGKPIGEPIAWYGPIVMNTEDELMLAFDEYQNGTFIKN
ncbi:MAG: pirin family protein [Bacteroidetes bacterium]|nr:pirin family protein [Bacteroidota bacterium]